MNEFRKRAFSVNSSEYPFESHWFERDGSFMHYLDEGEGLPVILLHGNPTWSFLYRKVIKQLEGVCRIVAPDYPGFGLSDHPPGYGYTPKEHAGWVGALIDHLALEHFVLVVQDWGGPIGLSIAVNRPSKVSGLVICNTWSWPADQALTQIFSAVFGGPIGRYLILQHNFFVRRIAPFRGALKSSEVFRAYIDPFPTPPSRMGTYVFPREIVKSAKWLESIESKLHLLVDKPVELVWAMKDLGFGNEKTIARWHNYFPDAPVDRIPDAGHYLQEESPDRVAAGIRRLLGRQAA